METKQQRLITALTPKADTLQNLKEELVARTAALQLHWMRCDVECAECDRLEAAEAEIEEQINDLADTMLDRIEDASWHLPDAWARPVIQALGL